MTRARAHMHARTLPNPEAIGPEIEEGAVNQPTNPHFAFPRPDIGLVRIRQINSPYYTNFGKSIPSSSVDNQIPLAGKVALATVTSRVKGGTTRAHTHMHALTLPNPEALGPEIEEGAVNRPTNPPLAFPRPGIGLLRIRKINSPYHTNFSKSIPSSSVDNQIPLAGKVALATCISRKNQGNVN